MPTDYLELRRENIERYGTDIGRIGPMLLAHRYADRAHFIFELLQNAEDAYSRLEAHLGSINRAIKFELYRTHLEVSHYGQPFEFADVRGICGIGESTKSEDLTTIGRFGIGFKAVYAFTDSPIIHSGDEHFAIDSFVWPRDIEPIALRDGETRFIFPFRLDDEAAFSEIASALMQLNMRTLLFLREIDEIHWSVEGNQSGLYMRSKPEQMSSNLRKVSLIGEVATKAVADEAWLIFSRPVATPNGLHAGFVELAFALDDQSGSNHSIRRIEDSTVVVFFPTIVATNLGFLTQGPYRTTPSRDNIPAHDNWNRHLVNQTAELLADALSTLRDLALLNVEALRSMPLERAKFPDDAMLSPLFYRVREHFQRESLLPCQGGEYVSADNAVLARGQGLRELIAPDQLGLLLNTTDGTNVSTEKRWLADTITADRTPELRHYLMRELKIREIDPEDFVKGLTKPFLEAQSDSWIVRLYGYLNLQQSAWQRNREKPFIRLEDGRHVPLNMNGQRQAFLPSSITTDFPTVRHSICQDEAARGFLERLGVTEPDPVDDVMQNVLPKYSQDGLDIADEDYHSDIERIIVAFETDSKTRRDSLVSALRETWFVMSVDSGTRVKYRCKPNEVYIPSQRLRSLFEGVDGVYFVDDDYVCLRGENLRELLVACGASRYLQPILIKSRFTWQELAELRRLAGAANSTSSDNIRDWTLRGLDELLKSLPDLPKDIAKQKSTLLWEALCDLEDRRKSNAFLGTYSWFYYQQHSTTFDASFVNLLNQTAWISDGFGNLVVPSAILFDSIDPQWAHNAFLLSKIRFKPPIIEALAREAGIDAAVLDLLKRYGLTKVEDLAERLGLAENNNTLEDDVFTDSDTTTQSNGVPQYHSHNDSRPMDDLSQSDLDDSLRSPTESQLGHDQPLHQPSTPRNDSDYKQFKKSTESSDEASNLTKGESTEPQLRRNQHERKEGNGRDEKRASTEQHGHLRRFVSYVTVEPEEENDDSELDDEARMELEEHAIQTILAREPALRRTPTNNPGFDLFETGPHGKIVKWVEVKAMSGSLNDRPVGLSRTQFEFALEHGEAYWLYIVEYTLEDSSQIIRIQDPAGKAQTFTFDHGWRQIGVVDE